jgi:hypothetical protein
MNNLKTYILFDADLSKPIKAIRLGELLKIFILLERCSIFLFN